MCRCKQKPKAMKKLVFAMLITAIAVSCKKEPPDTSIHLGATINGKTWTDKERFAVGSFIEISLDWRTLPAGSDNVEIEIMLYDSASHSILLTSPIYETAQQNTYFASINTTAISDTSSGWLQIIVTPAKSSGKQAATLTANLFNK